VNRCVTCFTLLQSASACDWCAGRRENEWGLLPPGTTLGERYLVGRRLIDGERFDIGPTYVALDRHSGDRVAIKECLPGGVVTRAEDEVSVVPRDGRAFSDLLAGFTREVALAKDIPGHPHRVSATDCVRQHGTAYAVMEFFYGQWALDYRSSRGRLPFQEAMDILRPVLEALAASQPFHLAWGWALPDRILLTDDGVKLLMPFTYVLRDPEIPFRMLANWEYAAPEAHTARRADGPVDVYAAAAMLYHLLTDNPPPHGLDRTTDDSLQPPSVLGVELSDRVETELLRALSVDPRRRPQTAREFLDILERSGAAN